MVDFNKKNPISFVAEFKPESDKLIYEHNEGKMPILCLRDNVLFPGTINPINVGREISVKTVKKVKSGDAFVGVFTQKDPNENNPTFESMLPYGVVGKVVHIMELPDDTYNVLLQTYNRAELKSMSASKSCCMGEVEAKSDTPHSEGEDFVKFMTVLDLLKAKLKELFETLGNYPVEMLKYLDTLEPSSFMLNVLCGLIPSNNEEKHKILAAESEIERGVKALKAINGMLDFAKLKQNIEHETQRQLDKQQREYFLMQEARNIQKELGGKDESSVRMEDIAILKEQASKKVWPEKVKKLFLKEVSKLERINIQSPDYNVQLSYLQTLLSLPWGTCTKDTVTIKQAEKVLNQDHYGMEKVKERILEHLAVMKLRGDMKSPIICLYGPPGVGKTSLGKSIARALKRQYVRVSLGGLHDESEIRGHRRTYIGAMPGRIIKGMQKAGSANPVFILDEIDKITEATNNGDPSSAMLEVLDPEQNSTFHDNYLDIDYDLSRVLFIATANDINTIPRPLLDRMELIEVGGYITEEKIEIAKRHLLPKKKDDNGLTTWLPDLKVSKQALEFIIERYTRESGVRALEKQIDKLCRKLAVKIANRDYACNQTLGVQDIEELLGKPIYSRDKYQGNDYAGVVTGLAWTSVGGEILFIETSLSKGKAGKLTLTGNLGDVMKESAMLALEYTKAHADILDIDTRVFDNYNIHIHVPEGAVPKDGPSAGVTMATSIASALTQRKVRSNLAMTGEITLRGKVLPVGGIKEKILAAKRAGITDIILCQENKKDIEEIPSMYLKGVCFHYVTDIADVWKLALLNEKVGNPLQFKFDEEEKGEDK